MNDTDFLIEHLLKICSDSKEDKVREQVKLCVLDIISVFECGRSISGSLDFKCNSLKDDAFVRGYYSHILELDDGHKGSMSHPGAVILSALLPLAAERNLAPEDLVNGIICGYETSLLLGSQIQPSHKKRGFHTSATCGTIGAAAAVATACGYDPDSLRSTLAAAVTCSSGTLLLQDDDSEMKPINIAVAALNGILAAEIGQLGLRAPKDPIGGKRGFYALYSDHNENSNEDSFSVRSEPLIMDIYRKKYAACRHAHAPIDCIMSITEDHNINTDKIDSISVNTYDLAIFGHDEAVPQNQNSARLSIPYCVAVALMNRTVAPKDFSERYIKDDDIIGLSKKVSLKEDSVFTNALPKSRGAAVRIKMYDGAVYSSSVMNPKGEPENPLSRDEIIDKAKTLLDIAGFESIEIDHIIESALSLDDDPTDLYRIIMQRR